MQTLSFIISSVAGATSIVAVIYLIKLNKKINYMRAMIEESQD